MHRLVVALMLVTVVALPREADACEDHVFSRTVDGIAADGSFVYVERNFGGRVFETVNVANHAGKRIARCEREDESTWRCDGDRRFRAKRAMSADRIAKSWAGILGPATPLVEETRAPVGITEAICARTASVYTGAGQIDCANTNAKPFVNASSPLVFLRFHVAPFKFCGGTSTHDEMTWVSRSALASRLAKRGAHFSARKRWALAERALEAWVWLSPNDAAAADALKQVRRTIEG
ncbi:MAG: hypothetical protein ACKV2T_05720 [Kofleriaceae bacterium]